MGEKRAACLVWLEWDEVVSSGSRGWLGPLSIQNLEIPLGEHFCLLLAQDARLWSGTAAGADSAGVRSERLCCREEITLHAGTDWCCMNTAAIDNWLFGSSVYTRHQLFRTISRILLSHDGHTALHRTKKDAMTRPRKVRALGVHLPGPSAPIMPCGRTEPQRQYRHLSTSQDGNLIATCSI